VAQARSRVGHPLVTGKGHGSLIREHFGLGSGALSC